MKIKVCGLREPENIKAVSALKPDYIGFICYEQSPRFIKGLPADEVKEIPSSISKTGVFVNESKEVINVFIKKYGFDAIQFHGDESPEFCGLFKDKVKVIKAFGVDNEVDFERLAPYINKVDCFLFDTKTSGYGGSGKTFDWNILANYKLNIPFILAGGISPDILHKVIKIDHPHLYGVDLNSGFEIDKGMKDIEKLKEAFDLLRKTGTHEIRS